MATDADRHERRGKQRRATQRQANQAANENAEMAPRQRRRAIAGVGRSSAWERRASQLASRRGAAARPEPQPRRPAASRCPAASRPGPLVPPTTASFPSHHRCRNCEDTALRPPPDRVRTALLVSQPPLPSRAGANYLSGAKPMPSSRSRRIRWRRISVDPPPRALWILVSHGYNLRSGLGSGD